MASLPVLLLTIALGARSALSLECYVCNTTKHTGCTRIETCSKTAQYCMRYTATNTNGFHLQLNCAEKCPIARSTWPALYTYTCCQESRCNSAASVRRPNLVLVLVVTITNLIGMKL